MLKETTIKAIAMATIGAEVKGVKAVGSTRFFRLVSPCGLNFSAMIDSDFGALEVAGEIYNSKEFFSAAK